MSKLELIFLKLKQTKKTLFSNKTLVLNYLFALKKNSKQSDKSRRIILYKLLS